MKISISTGIEIEINDTRTRKVDREYQMALSENVSVGSDGLASFPASNVQKANDVLVMGMTGMSQKELDVLSIEDYDLILSTINSEYEKKSQAKK